MTTFGCQGQYKLFRCKKSIQNPGVTVNDDNDGNCHLLRMYYVLVFLLSILYSLHQNHLEKILKQNEYRKPVPRSLLRPNEHPSRVWKVRGGVYVTGWDALSSTEPCMGTTPLSPQVTTGELYSRNQCLEDLSNLLNFTQLLICQTWI